ncbi:MAG: TonB-dependent receptor [Planctomycetales bacterium]|nr:TonB-dependent receptor [Planctomycetales bacterium]
MLNLVCCYACVFLVNATVSAQEADTEPLQIRVAQATPPLNPQSGSPDQAPQISSQQNRNSVSREGDNSLPASLFNRRLPTDLNPHRQQIANLPGADIVLGFEAFTRAATKSDDLLSRSQSAVGLSAQRRTPISTDLRIRGSRSGQLLASGSYWAPARADLDTMLNKIDSSIVQNMIAIKGPYSVRYGPGFGFVDLQLATSPRHEDGYQWNGATSLTYKTNGEQWFGRQTLTGGAENWGYFVSYGHSTGSDYEDAINVPVPSSFKSRDLFATIGYDIDESKSFEFTYLRLDQTDLEFPGLVFDIDYLVTDGFEAEFENDMPIFGDYFRAEGWHNRTHFRGDTLGQGKAFQIPQLRTILFSPSGTNGFGITDVDGASTGYRFSWDFHLSPEETIVVGTDMIHLDTELNDIEPFLPPNDNNFPIPASYSNDAGLFVEHHADYTPVRLTSGGRIDFVNTHAVRNVRGVPVDLEVFKDGDLDQHFTLWSAFLLAERDLNNHWTANAGVAFGERPPTLTELYATASFIGTLQRGLTSVNGDPLLDPERMRQITVGLEGNYEDARMGVHAFHSWIKDFIAFDLISLPDEFDEGFSNAVQFTNTDLATLAGFEGYGEFDLLDQLTAFGNI